MAELIFKVNKILNSGTRTISISKSSARKSSIEELEEIKRLCKLCGVLLEIEGVGKWDYRPEPLRKKSGCFITTACIEAMGLPDNCPELQEMRLFRDEYVKNLPYGERLIQEYYEIAPTIVEAINDCEDPMNAYMDLFERIVKVPLSLIHSNRNDEALENILNIVGELKHKYLENTHIARGDCNQEESNKPKLHP